MPHLPIYRRADRRRHCEECHRALAAAVVRRRPPRAITVRTAAGAPPTYLCHQHAVAARRRDRQPKGADR